MNTFSFSILKMILLFIFKFVSTAQSCAKMPKFETTFLLSLHSQARGLYMAHSTRFFLPIFNRWMKFCFIEPTIIQTWTNGTVTFRSGVTTHIINIRHLKPYYTYDFSWCRVISLYFFFKQRFYTEMFFKIWNTINYNLIADIWWHNYQKIYLNHGGQCNTLHMFYTLMR